MINWEEIKEKFHKKTMVPVLLQGIKMKDQAHTEKAEKETLTECLYHYQQQQLKATFTEHLLCAGNYFNLFTDIYFI